MPTIQCNSYAEGCTHTHTHTHTPTDLHTHTIQGLMGKLCMTSVYYCVDQGSQYTNHVSDLMFS